MAEIFKEKLSKKEIGGNRKEDMKIVNRRRRTKMEKDKDTLENSKVQDELKELDNLEDSLEDEDLKKLEKESI